MKTDYEQRLRRLLIGSLSLLAMVGSLAILFPTPFKIGCAVMTAICTVITFRSWYIVHRHLARKNS